VRLSGAFDHRVHIFSLGFLRRFSFPQMLKAIWPSIARLPNHLPPSANITTTGTSTGPAPKFLDSSHAACFIGMICYFLYWLIQLPFMFVSPQKIRWLFLAKAIIVPPTWLALLIWAFVKVPPGSGILARKAELSGSALSWAWLGALNSALGLYSTLGVNIPDFTVSHTCLF
jgi:NCS1 family nucleobase:cation symporter-1